MGVGLGAVVLGSGVVVEGGGCVGWVLGSKKIKTPKKKQKTQQTTKQKTKNKKKNKKKKKTKTGICGGSGLDGKGHRHRLKQVYIPELGWRSGGKNTYWSPKHLYSGHYLR